MRFTKKHIGKKICHPDWGREGYAILKGFTKEGHYKIRYKDGEKDKIDPDYCSNFDMRFWLPITEKEKIDEVKKPIIEALMHIDKALVLLKEAINL